MTDDQDMEHLPVELRPDGDSVLVSRRGLWAMIERVAELQAQVDAAEDGEPVRIPIAPDAVAMVEEQGCVGGDCERWADRVATLEARLAQIRRAAG